MSFKERFYRDHPIEPIDMSACQATRGEVVVYGPEFNNRELSFILDLEVDPHRNPLVAAIRNIIAISPFKR